MLIKILFYNNKNYSKKYLWSKIFIGIECFLHRNFFILFIYIYIIIYIIIIFIYIYNIIIIKLYLIIL